MASMILVGLWDKADMSLVRRMETGVICTLSEGFLSGRLGMQHARQGVSIYVSISRMAQM